MRIAEYRQVSTEAVTETVTVDDYDESCELVGKHEETVAREVPVMGMFYRDATPEEEAQAAADAAAAEEWERTRPRTAEERVAELEDALLELAGIIGGEQ